MGTFVVNRLALSTSIATALLGGCGSQPLLPSPLGQGDIIDHPSHQRTFHYTGKKQSFTVPAGVTYITIRASGASGPSQGGSSCYFTGGNGGIVNGHDTRYAGKDVRDFRRG